MSTDLSQDPRYLQFMRTIRDRVELVTTRSTLVSIEQREAAARQLLEVQAIINDFMADMRFKITQDLGNFPDS